MHKKGGEEWEKVTLQYYFTLLLIHEGLMDGWAGG